MPWFQIFLFLHIAAVIIAFGPSFTFPLIAAHAQRNPEHGHAAAEVAHTIESKLVIPVAIGAGVTGLLVLLTLLFTIHLDLTRNLWLVLGILLYLVAVTFALARQGPNSARLVALAAQGPSPEIELVSGKLRAGGMFLTVMLIAILLLMVFRPFGTI
jgi:uncharacterized membrane protein